VRRLAWLFLVVAACNPGDFSDIPTWVDSTDAPDNLNSDDYGAAVAFAGTSGQGATIAVLSREPAGLVLLDYDASGRLDRRLQILSQRVAGLLSLQPRPAIASDPAGFGDAPNLAIGGTDGDDVPYAVLLSAESFEFPDPITFGTSGGAPAALAIGDTSSGDPGTPDLLALVGDTLWLAENYPADEPALSSCDVPGARNLIAVQLDDAVGAEILVAADAGLVLLQGQDVVDATCAGAAVDVGDGEDDLGAAMVVGDFDGNDEVDVAVGAPSGNAVYVVLNSNIDEPIPLSGPGGSGAFGEALAAGDFDGDGNDELVVGDSLWSDDINGGGVARIFALAGDRFDELAELHDSDPESNQHFGRSVTVASFNGDDDIVSVGASEEVFTYFRLPVAGDQDVRSR
jgi:hypothetical protein